jgi:hypothetical protein
VDGYGRFDAATEFKLEQIPVIVHPDWDDLTEDQLVTESRARNIQTRRNMTEPLWVELGMSIKSEIETKRQAQEKAYPEAGKATAEADGKLSIRDAVAEELTKLGFPISGRHFDKAQEVKKSGKPVVELYDQGLVSADLAYRVNKVKVESSDQKDVIKAIKKLPTVDGKRRAARNQFKKLIQAKLEKHPHRTVKALLAGLTEVLKKKKLSNTDLQRMIEDPKPKKGKKPNPGGGKELVLKAIDEATERLNELKGRVEAMQPASE